MFTGQCRKCFTLSDVYTLGSDDNLSLDKQSNHLIKQHPRTYDTETVMFDFFGYFLDDIFHVHFHVNSNIF